MTTREEMSSLVREIIRAYEDRISGLDQLRETVKTDLKGFQNSRTAMTREVRADLAKGVAERKHEVGVMLDGFGQALATMGKEMRADLARGIAERKHEVGVMLDGFNAELKNIRLELAGGRDEWQKRTATPSQRGSVAVAVKPLIEKIPEETAALREQVFEYLANHPDGTRMTELEKEFGLARIQMAKIIRNFRDENKVEKQELLYFAV